MPRAKRARAYPVSSEISHAGARHCRCLAYSSGMDRRPRAATLCHRMSCPSVAFAVALAVGLAVGLCFGWMLTPNGPAALLGPASAHTFTSKRGPAAHWPAADWPASTRDGAAPSGTAPPGSPRHGAARASEARDVASTRACTLALVLAVDVSGSVDREEYALQIGGLADAFRTEDIASAINAGGSTGIFVTLVQWSGATRHTQVVPWRFLTSEASTRAFADEIEQQARAFRIYATGIGEALAYAGSLFAGPPDRKSVV